MTTIRVGWCSEGQLSLTPRKSHELNVQTLRKRLFSLLLSEAVQLFPFPYEHPVIKRKCVLASTKPKLTCAVSKVNYIEDKVFYLEFMPMCHILWSGASCCIIHNQTWPFRLLSWPCSPTFTSPSSRLPPIPQFVEIMRILLNLYSYKKYTRGIIPVAGARSERAWNRLPSCNHALFSTGMQPESH